MCRDHLLLDACPLVPSNIALWLSWCMMLGFIGYPCSSKNSLSTGSMTCYHALPLFLPGWTCCVDPLLVGWPVHHASSKSHIWPRVTTHIAVHCKYPIYEPVILIKMSGFHGKPQKFCFSQVLNYADEFLVAILIWLHDFGAQEWHCCMDVGTSSFA